jgi:predicted RNA-binding Zn-ribbon protein involved in translation (DUF1610 family)
MPKDHIQVICPKCGTKSLTEWPAPRERHAQTECPNCKAVIPIAEAVERTIVGEHDRHDMHLIPKEDR